MELIEQVKTPEIAICGNQLKFFTEQEIRNAIYRYNENLTNMSDKPRTTSKYFRLYYKY